MKKLGQFVLSFILVVSLLGVAKGFANPPNWTPIDYNLENIAAGGYVYINGVKISVNGYKLGAFGTAGDTDCRAVGDISNAGSYYMTIKGPNSEFPPPNNTIHFKVYDSNTDQIYDVDETISFIPENDYYGPLHVSIKTYYRDLDGDGYGQSNDSQSLTSPDTVNKYTALQGEDCADNDADRHPNHAEVCDGKDNDCDDYIDNGIGCGICGDADGDGQVKMADALLVARYVVHLINESQIQGLTYCNVNGTPGIQMGDALLIARFVVKLVPTLLCQ